MIRVAQRQHGSSFLRLVWDPGITGLGSSTTERIGWTFIEDNHLDFPLGFSFEKSVSLFNDLLGFCSISLWWQHFELEEAAIGLWGIGSFFVRIGFYFQVFTLGVHGISSLVG